jgi:hypothetical protein
VNGPARPAILFSPLLTLLLVSVAVVKVHTAVRIFPCVRRRWICSRRWRYASRQLFQEQKQSPPTISCVRGRQGRPGSPYALNYWSNAAVSNRRLRGPHPWSFIQLSYMCVIGAATETRTPVCLLRTNLSLPPDDCGALVSRPRLEPRLAG